MSKVQNSNGAAIFKKMLDDKNAIRAHLLRGGKIEDLKDQYRFADPLSFIKKK